MESVTRMWSGWWPSGLRTAIRPNHSLPSKRYWNTLGQGLIGIPWATALDTCSMQRIRIAVRCSLIAMSGRDGIGFDLIFTDGNGFTSLRANVNKMFQQSRSKLLRPGNTGYISKMLHCQPCQTQKTPSVNLHTVGINRIPLIFKLLEDDKD